MNNKFIALQYKTLKAILKPNALQARIILESLELCYLEGKIEVRNQITK